MNKLFESGTYDKRTNKNCFCSDTLLFFFVFLRFFRILAIDFGIIGTTKVRRVFRLIDMEMLLVPGSSALTPRNRSRSYRISDAVSEIPRESTDFRRFSSESDGRPSTTRTSRVPRAFAPLNFQISNNRVVSVTNFPNGERAAYGCADERAYRIHVYVIASSSSSSSPARSKKKKKEEIYKKCIKNKKVETTTVLLLLH